MGMLYIRVDNFPSFSFFNESVPKLSSRNVVVLYDMVMRYNSVCVLWDGVACSGMVLYGDKV